MDFVEGDWRALRWALGSATALCRHSVTHQLAAWLRAWRLRVGHRTWTELQKSVRGVIAGVLFTGGVLAVYILGFLRVVPVVLPQWERAPFQESLVFFAIPGGILALAVAALWQRKRSVASGIVLGAMTLAVHVVIHVASHG